jgi:hypothetical protein
MPALVTPHPSREAGGCSVGAYMTKNIEFQRSELDDLLSGFWRPCVDSASRLSNTPLQPTSSDGMRDLPGTRKHRSRLSGKALAGRKGQKPVVPKGAMHMEEMLVKRTKGFSLWRVAVSLVGSIGERRCRRG